MLKCLKLSLFILFPIFLNAQTAVITGVILDSTNQTLANVNITTATNGTTSDANGFYLLEVTADKKISITFSHLGHKNIILKNIILSTNETFEFNPIFKTDVTQIDEITVSTSGEKNITGITMIDPDMIRLIPGANAGVENVLKLLPGVSSNNELSTQYNVRGGNFDENLVYVNEIEVYRPFLIRAGEQENLSFVNSDMIQQVKFSAGGFQAKYGDKLASVLDITYKIPVAFGLKVDANLMGFSTTLETSSKNKKLSSLTGIRYRDISHLINSQQTVTNVQPRVFDIQTFENYQFSSKFSLGFLGNISLNNYLNEPRTRTTNFGTINNPKSVSIFYEGQENNRFNTTLAALKATYVLNDKVTLKLIPSVFYTLEEESTNIIAQYELGDLNIGLNEVNNTRRLGTQLNRARNILDGLVFNLAHKGSYLQKKSVLDWGVKYTHEDIRDQIQESQFLDSLGFFVRPPASDFINNEPESLFEAPIEALQSIQATNFVTTNRFSGYLQYSNQTKWKTHNIYYNLGFRSHYWKVSTQNNDENLQWVFSPRGQFAIKPDWAKDMFFKIALGIYHQPPFYRELRDVSGAINTNVKAQSAFHAIATNEYSFRLWDSPFKLISEMYYKDLANVNTYTVEDVRLRYVANNNATAYVYGAELRMNGPFVPGTESWISLGYLKTEENSNNRGYISRPTDQRFKGAILFQDYIPSIPDLKMYLNLVYQTGVPGGSPNNADPYLFQSRLRDYKRADLGISYTFVNENKKAKENSWLTAFEELSTGFEIFNLFNTQNSITNTWIRDIDSKNQFAVPNFLTSRIFNIRVTMRF